MQSAEKIVFSMHRYTDSQTYKNSFKQMIVPFYNDIISGNSKQDFFRRIDLLFCYKIEPLSPPDKIRFDLYYLSNFYAC